MGEALYRKKGRRYVPALDVEPWSHDRMEPGAFRLTHCYEAGARRYEYDVTPDRAAWRAAAMEAKAGMVKAMQERAIATPEAPETAYTPQQKAIVEKFRQDMAEAGGLLPRWWRHAKPEQIADAGVEAVAPKKQRGDPVALRIVEQGAVRVNAAAIERDCGSVVLVYVDLHSKYAEFGCVMHSDKDGPRIVLEASELTRHLDDTRPRESHTMIEFAEYPGWQVFATEGPARYTMGVTLVAPDASSQSANA